MNTKHIPHRWYPVEVLVKSDAPNVFHVSFYCETQPSGLLEARKHANLAAAAPELLEAQTMGEQLNTPEFLDWLADRLIHVYHESPNIDFVLSLRARAEAGRKALSLALTGKL